MPHGERIFHPNCHVCIARVFADGFANVLEHMHARESIAYRRVPKTYLAMKDRELVSAPTKRPARNGHNTKSFNTAGLLTTACA